MSAFTDPAAAQDALRPVRNFLSLLSGATADQTWAWQDAYAVNTTGQFATRGPNGIAVEGQPYIIGTVQQAATNQQTAGVPAWLLIAGAVALVLVLKG